MKNLASLGIITIIILNSASPGYMKIYKDAKKYNKIDSAPLLKVLGIPPVVDKPRRRDPPQYMLDLYQEVSKKGSESSAVLYNASTVRAYYETDNGEGNNFYFRLGDDDNVPLQSEFIIYYSHFRDLNHHHLLAHHLYKLEVYARTMAGKIFLGSNVVTNNDKGWQKFKMGRRIVDYADARRVVKLEVIAKKMDGRLLQIQFHHGKKGSTAPLLIIYSQQEQLNDFRYNFEKKSKGTMRFKRAIADDIESGMTHIEPVDNVIDSLEDETENKTTMFVEIIPRCKVAPLIVNFTEIGGTAVIIYPLTYDAGQCVGECDFPMGSSQSPTNHAMLLSSLSSLRQDTDYPVKAPCCSPTQYSPLSMLLYDGKSKESVILKTFHEMSVDSCGCR